MQKWMTNIFIALLCVCHGRSALNSESGSISDLTTNKIQEKIITKESTVWTNDLEEDYSVVFPDSNDAGVSYFVPSSVATETAPPNPSKQIVPAAVKNEAIEQTLSLLQEGTEQMSTNIPDDIILVLGNTGAGKSTMTLFLTGNNSELIAYEKDPVTILIKDNRNKISTSTIVSKTIFPELFVDEETGTAFYDCPGFSDTRNTTIEIVNSFFIKKLAERAKRIKIVLVVNHSSLKPGGDRKDFMLLVKHTTDLLRNIDNFNDSIALIATKCESRRNENRVIKGMVQFLAEAKSQFHTVLSDEADLASASKLINILLQKDVEGVYSKLTYFQQPDDIGPLSEIDAVQNRKEHMKHVIFDNIHFTDKSSTDFGYSISPQAKNDVRNLTDSIDGQIVRLLENIGRELETHYKQLLQHVNNQTFNEIQQELQIFFNNSIAFQGLLDTNNTDTSSAEFLTKIGNMSWPNVYLDIEEQGRVVKGAIHNGEYLDFLQSVTQSKSDSELIYLHKRWSLPISNFISTVKQLAIEFSHQQNQKMLDLFDQVSEKLVDYYQNKFNEIIVTNSMNGTDFEGTLIRLLSFLEKWEHFSTETLNSMTLSEFTHDVLFTINVLSPTILEENLQLVLTNCSNFLSFIKSDSINILTKHSQAMIDQSKWFESFKKFIPQVRLALRIEDNLKSKLAESLTELASIMESYYAQKFDSTATEDLKEQLENDMLHFKATFNSVEGSSRVGTKIIYELSKGFTAPLWSYEAVAAVLINVEVECELLAILHSEDERQNGTTAVTAKTINSWFSPLKNFMKSLEDTIQPAKCELKKLDGNQVTAVIQGTFISLSEVSNSCLSLSQGISNVLITSLHTVYLDSDLNGLEFSPQSNFNLTIISPNWVVRTSKNSSRINLNGPDGKEHKDFKEEADGVLIYKGEGEGLDGSAGFAGGNAGNFLGIGHSISGGKVEIYATGGKGGKGQDGAVGKQGANAEDVNIAKIQYTSHFMQGSNLVQIIIEQCDPYKYKQLEYGCTTSKNNDKETQETFRLFNLIPLGTTTKVQKETLTIYNCQDFEFYDPRGTPGKQGGHGGAPGLGGKGGLSAIEFPENFNSSEIFFSFNSDGNEGLYGQGGNGGEGGLLGNQVKLRIFPTHGNYDGYIGGKKILTASNLPRASRGPSGKAGVNQLESRMQPAPVSYSSRDTKIRDLIVFKSLAEPNLINPYVRNTLAKFFEQLWPTPTPTSIEENLPVLILSTPDENLEGDFDNSTTVSTVPLESLEIMNEYYNNSIENN